MCKPGNDISNICQYFLATLESHKNEVSLSLHTLHRKGLTKKIGVDSKQTNYHGVKLGLINGHECDKGFNIGSGHHTSEH